MAEYMKKFLKVVFGVDYDDRPGFDDPQTSKPERSIVLKDSTQLDKAPDEELMVFDPEAIQAAVSAKYEEQEAKKQSDFEGLVERISKDIINAIASNNYKVIASNKVEIQEGLDNTYEGVSEILNWKDQIRDAVNRNLSKHGLKLVELSIYESMFSDVTHRIREKYTVVITGSNKTK